MHGRIKVRTSEEQKTRKEKERQEKLKAYKQAFTKIQQKRQSREKDTEMLKLTDVILCGNPDIYTLWNIRREVISHFIETTKSNKDIVTNESENEGQIENNGKVINLKKLFDDELYLTEYCLKINPKSYSAWHQREWVLLTRTDPDWKKEFDLCNYYLRLDERNFHTWDYRRFIVSHSNITLEDEFKYTTEKIMENFSNYSAWHYRSKMLVHLYPDEKGGRPIEDAHHKEELKMIQSAAFTDPDDTSSWFYQRWLLGAVKSESKIVYCSVETPLTIITIFDKAISKQNIVNNIQLQIGNMCTDFVCESLNKKISDVLWYLHLNHTRIIHGVEIQLKHFEQEIILNRSPGDNACHTFTKYDFKKNYSDEVTEELHEQLNSCNQLLELEPDNRWTLLSKTFILHSLNPSKHFSQIMESFNKLMKLDHLRTGFYKDWASKLTIENYLIKNNISTQMPPIGDQYSYKLTCLHHMQYWSQCVDIDFSRQNLTSRSLPLLVYLVKCVKLNLGHNEITNIASLPKLPSLNWISLKHNEGLDGTQVKTTLHNIYNPITIEI